MSYTHPSSVLNSLEYKDESSFYQAGNLLDFKLYVFGHTLLEQSRLTIFNAISVHGPSTLETDWIRWGHETHQPTPSWPYNTKHSVFLYNLICDTSITLMLPSTYICHFILFRLPRHH